VNVFNADPYTTGTYSEPPTTTGAAQNAPSNNAVAYCPEYSPAPTFVIQIPFGQ
jgi:hypothetical protein